MRIALAILGLVFLLSVLGFLWSERAMTDPLPGPVGIEKWYSDAHAMQSAYHSGEINDTQLRAWLKANPIPTGAVTTSPARTPRPSASSLAR